jgi:mannan endo-1,4-beta-mannosidase
MAYAAAVKAYGHPVIFSFGHEMNGDWYSWGSGSQTPEAFVASWRHVVTVFRAAGASNVTWMWAVSSAGETGKNAWLGQWWPGTGWATLVGIDGYYYRASDSYTSVFGTTLGQIRQFTSAPVVISEVGVGINASRGSQISALFSGARADGIGALIWFDVAQHAGLYHQDWRLEDDPAALSAFKAAAAL